MTTTMTTTTTEEEVDATEEGRTAGRPGGGEGDLDQGQGVLLVEGMQEGITHLKGERGAHQCQAEDTGIN